VIGLRIQRINYQLFEASDFFRSGSWSKHHQIRNLPRNFDRLSLVSVGKDDDRQVLAGETKDGISEASG
jgi:hypothetical protein